MTVVEIPAIPAYRRYSKSLGPDDLKPELASVGDVVKVGRREGRLVSWDLQDAKTCVITFGFDLEEHPTAKITFVARPKMWWDNLVEVGEWAHRLTDLHQRQLRAISDAIATMKMIEEEALEHARRHWSDDEIEEAKAHAPKRL